VDWLAASGSAAFWKSLLEIIVVNAVLSGDNAVVIAMAARTLPASQQKRAVLYGSVAAIVLRVLLTVFAVELLRYPYLKLAGGALLLWIGAKLLLPDDEGDINPATSLWTAVRTILVADLVMSLDNVIAVAAAAQTGPEPARLPLLVVGLGLSIPLIMVGSQLLLRLMSRWPFIVTLGAALLGFVAGEMAMTDPALVDLVHSDYSHFDTAVAFACAVAVVALGKLWSRHAERSRPLSQHSTGAPPSPS